MIAFLKRWRKAYLEDKGNRLHAEAENERNMAHCNSSSSMTWGEAFHNAHCECTRYEEEQAYYR